MDERVKIFQKQKQTAIEEKMRLKKEQDLKQRLESMKIAESKFQNDDDELENAMQEVSSFGVTKKRQKDEPHIRCEACFKFIKESYMPKHQETGIHKKNVQ
ncbi:MAG: hypothetical protein MHPSP_001435, partial [Paramarteilia canceri]